jgi:hypothetical protein
MRAVDMWVLLSMTRASSPLLLTTAAFVGRFRADMIGFLRARGVTHMVQESWFEPCSDEEVWSRMLRNLLQQLTQRPNKPSKLAGGGVIVDNRVFFSVS